MVRPFPEHGIGCEVQMDGMTGCTCGLIEALQEQSKHPSHEEYQNSLAISLTDAPFYALICAAMRRADSTNIEILKRAFPDVYSLFQERVDAPGGLLPGEEGTINGQMWYRSNEPPYHTTLLEDE